MIPGRRGGPTFYYIKSGEDRSIFYEPEKIVFIMTSNDNINLKDILCSYDRNHSLKRRKKYGSVSVVSTELPTLNKESQRSNQQKTKKKNQLYIRMSGRPYINQSSAKMIANGKG